MQTIDRTKPIIPDMIRGLIFDCDGTLSDSMDLHIASWKKAFDSFGASFDLAFLAPLNGMREIDIVELYNRTFGTRLDGRTLVSEKHRFLLTGLDLIRPVESVIRLVMENYGQRPMCVVSGSTEAFVLGTLNRLGISDRFVTVLTADDPFPPKPAPDLFLEAARHMKVPPEYCLVFEDGALGIEGAHQAGMLAFDVNRWQMA